MLICHITKYSGTERKMQTKLAIVKIKQHESYTWPQAVHDTKKVSRSEWFDTNASGYRK
jgi:hypothetical protein